MRSDRLCALETSVLVSSQRNSFEVSAHSRSLECNSSQAFQMQLSDQTEWSLSQVFNIWCSRWARPHVELFATRFNHKLPKFVSPVPDPTAWAVDALSPPWENLDVYTFPPVSLLGHIISKVMDQGCHRMIPLLQGGPTCLGFGIWSVLSVQILFRLPIQRIW